MTSQLSLVALCNQAIRWVPPPLAQPRVMTEEEGRPALAQKRGAARRPRARQVRTPFSRGAGRRAGRKHRAGLALPLAEWGSRLGFKFPCALEVCRTRDTHQVPGSTFIRHQISNTKHVPRRKPAPLRTPRVGRPRPQAGRARVLSPPGFRVSRWLPPSAGESPAVPGQGRTEEGVRWRDMTAGRPSHQDARRLATVISLDPVSGSQGHPQHLTLLRAHGRASGMK